MNPKTEFKRMWTSDLWTSDQFCLAYKQDGDKAEIKRKRQFGICFEAKLARLDMIATENYNCILLQNSLSSQQI